MKAGRQLMSDAAPSRGECMAEIKERMIDNIAQHYGRLYREEQASGQFPNVGLIIRDALIEFSKRMDQSK